MAGEAVAWASVARELRVRVASSHRHRKYDPWFVRSDRCNGHRVSGK